VPSRAQAVVVGNVADPCELAAVELGVAEQWLDRHAARDGAEHAAVLGRHRIKILRRALAAGARHVLRNDGGIARDMLAHEARKQTRIDVVTAAGAEADRHLDAAAFVEFLDALCTGRNGRCDHRQRGDQVRAGEWTSAE
jgi:hypothetical protein